MGKSLHTVVEAMACSCVIHSIHWIASGEYKYTCKGGGGQNGYKRCLILQHAQPGYMFSSWKHINEVSKGKANTLMTVGKGVR